VATVRFIVEERRNGQRVTGLEDRSLVSLNWQPLEGPVFTCTVRTSESSGESNVVLLTGSRGQESLEKRAQEAGEEGTRCSKWNHKSSSFFPLYFFFKFYLWDIEGRTEVERRLS